MATTETQAMSTSQAGGDDLITLREAAEVARDWAAARGSSAPKAHSLRYAVWRGALRRAGERVVPLQAKPIILVSKRELLAYLESRPVWAAQRRLREREQAQEGHDGSPQRD